MTWHISKIIGGDVVAFMVPNAEMSQSTLQKLQEFSPELPRTVSVKVCQS